ncbi:unnamed protein product [Protopolystoma xenopodis]|uniref:Uncharacterized protein n=1 Tax=Protopolystoma xenopodis TaxID=117903 RepID=A0A448XKX7_9PLAT|nr:unnamed protein product [Protopolystoma xenopodis]
MAGCPSQTPSVATLRLGPPSPCAASSSAPPFVSVLTTTHAALKALLRCADALVQAPLDPIDPMLTSSDPTSPHLT